MTDSLPLDADELMDFAERIEQLPPADAEWVGRLFQECLRARMHEAEALYARPDEPAPDTVDSDIESQLAQVALDAAEWLKTLWDVGYMGAGSFPAQPRSAFPLIELEDVLKSALFARIREGKRPLPFPPPTRNGSPWHELIEGLPLQHVVAAEVVRDEEDRAVAAIIEGCADWRIVDERTQGTDFTVQHRGIGPLFHLRLGDSSAVLEREPPRFVQTIRIQERGGYRSHVLDWQQPDGRLQSVPLRAASTERAESEAAHWVATKYPELYGQVRFVLTETAS